MIHEQLKAFGVNRLPGRLKSMVEQDFTEDEIMAEVAVCCRIFTHLAKLNALLENEKEFLDKFGPIVEQYFW